MTEFSGLKSIFQNRFLFYFLVSLVIILRVKHEIYFPAVESDDGVIIEAAKNFTNGMGFSNCDAGISDLSKMTITPLTMWPIGYSILLVPIYLVFKNWFVACIFWQSIGVLALIFFMYRILKLFNVSQNTLYLFLLFMAFTPTPFYYSGTTDVLSVDIFLWCTYIILKCSVNDNFKWKHFLLIGFLSASSCFLRFASIPNLVIFPLLFIFLSFIKKEKKLLYGGVLTAIVSLVFVVLFFSVFKIDSGRTGFIDNIINLNFYYNHIKWFDSFPIKSFFYTTPIEYRLPVNMPELIRYYRIGLHIASVLLLFFLGYKFLFLEKVYKFHWIQDLSRKSRLIYFYIFLLTSCVVIGFIALESLTTSPEKNSFGPPWMPQLWTFVYSTRYFILLMIMLQIAFFVMLSELAYSQKVFKLFSVSFFTISFLFSFIFWVFTSYQIHSPNGNGGASYWNNCSEHVIFYDEINKISKNENKKVVFTSYNLPVNAPSMIYSMGYPCHNYSDLLSSELKHSSPLCLLIEIPQEQNEIEKIFREKFSPTKIIKFKESILYRIDLK